MRKIILAVVILFGTLSACSAQPARGFYCPPGTQRFCEGGQCICISK